MSSVTSVRFLETAVVSVLAALFGVVLCARAEVLTVGVSGAFPDVQTAMIADIGTDVARVRDMLILSGNLGPVPIQGCQFWAPGGGGSPRMLVAFACTNSSYATNTCSTDSESPR